MLVFGGVHRLNNAWIWMNMIVSQVSAFCRFAAKELPERNGGRGFLISDLAKFILYFRVWPTWKTDENRGMWRCKVSKDDDFSRRRTRVVECPSGIDVSGVNALSVAEFLSTVTQQQTGWRDLKVSWSIHHSRFNCEGYRDVERAWKNLTSHMQIMFDAAVYQCFSSAEARPANLQRNMDMTWQRAWIGSSQ